MRRKEPATSAGSASGEWTPIFRPHRLWSFPGVATARAEMTGPSPSCLGNQAAAECTSSPVGRHGALLAASRARSSRPHGRNGMLWCLDKTDEPGGDAPRPQPCNGSLSAASRG